MARFYLDHFRRIAYPKTILPPSILICRLHCTQLAGFGGRSHKKHTPPSVMGQRNLVSENLSILFSPNLFVPSLRTHSSQHFVLGISRNRRLQSVFSTGLTTTRCTETMPDSQQVPSLSRKAWRPWRWTRRRAWTTLFWANRTSSTLRGNFCW